MGKSGKGKHKSVSKLRKYGELLVELSKGKGKEKGESSKSKGKGKAKEESKSSTVKEMEAIESWVMSKKQIAVESVDDVRMLLEISDKCGPYKGHVKIKGGNPEVKAGMRKLAKKNKLRI